MKFEKLTDKKIKIIVSLKDMELNNVSAKNIFSNTDASQKLLQTILNMAEKEIGFKAGNSKLLVEAIMSSDEECTFTITKLSEKKIKLKNISNSFIFKFNSFDNFIDLCTFIKNMSNLNLKEFSKNFSLILYNNTYYLSTVEVEAFSILFDYMKTIFSEFGENVSNSIGLDGILNEYGKIIFDKNAFLQCNRYFKRQL